MNDGSGPWTATQPIYLHFDNISTWSNKMHIYHLSVCKHSSSLHPQMQGQTLPCKGEHKHDSDTPSLGPRTFKIKILNSYSIHDGIGVN